MATSKAIFPVGQGTSCNSEKSTKFTSRSPGLATVGKWEKCFTIDKTGLCHTFPIFFLPFPSFSHLFPILSFVNQLPIDIQVRLLKVLCQLRQKLRRNCSIHGTLDVVPLLSASNLLLYELNRNSSALWVK